MIKKCFQRGRSYILFLVFLLTACDDQTVARKEYPFLFTGQTMGTSFTVKVSVLPESSNAEQLQDQIKKLLVDINRSMSTYQEDSELSKFNNSQSTGWQPVSDALFFVLKCAQKVSRLSEGAFDITIGRLVNLWGFGPDASSFREPADELIAEQLNQTGYNHLILRESPISIKKLKASLYLDLSALAKGYAVDQIAELLETQKIYDYLVEIGGEIRLNGNNINHQPWRIAIESPTPELRNIQKVISITNLAIATSGDYRNFFERDNMRYSHTIDPRTGRPVIHNLASVTLLHKTAIEADALATALMVLGPEIGYTLAERQGIAALFIIKTDAGFEEQSTSTFTEYTR